jgi:hypothetical protein
MQSRSERYVEAVKKARKRGAPIPQRRRTTTCWNSPTNLLTHGYIDPAAHDDDDKLQRIQAALEARHIDRADENVRRFLDECGL